MSNSYNSWRTGIQIDNIYPVGSIYMSINNTDPGTLFGGVWEQIQDTFLLCAGSVYAGGSTGGSASSAHTHTLSHTHTLAHTHGMSHYHWTMQGDTDGTGNAYLTTDATGFNRRSITKQAHRVHEDSWGSATYLQLSTDTGTRTATDGASTTTTSGASTATTSVASSSDNMPPYLAVYVFKRIA